MSFVRIFSSSSISFSEINLKFYEVKWKTASLYGNVSLTDTNNFINL